MSPGGQLVACVYDREANPERAGVPNFQPHACTKQKRTIQRQQLCTTTTQQTSGAVMMAVRFFIFPGLKTKQKNG
jgi:hypothetical protein